MADATIGMAVEAQAVNGGSGHGEIVYEQLLPHLFVKAPHASDAIEFYKKAFGAEEVAKSHHPKRKADQDVPLILHAHLKFGAAEIMVCDDTADAGPNVKPPSSVEATTAILHLQTNNAEAAIKRAIEAGAKVSEEVSDQPWGQRYGKVVDPYGFVWSIATPLAAGAATKTSSSPAPPEEAVALL
ncbi:uncharacterized protein LOC9660448 [Selaginella moellendorffii]|uniref:uncharacterized protein LOC9660448 n=1 Tax=Selaginella moellendorffii TaxID=88036 RepID=UPI000D1C7F0C|nr:uncharacterized protein LOC9660448 [Selaginella moellendorffii]|eukprot:XP_024516341.1 uncharacterized protein LOC9660448 [Selaginella moellendorffii]